MTAALPPAMLTERHRTFLSCDWGTSRFRLRLVQRERGETLSEVETGEGTQQLASTLGVVARETDRGLVFAEVLSRHARRLCERLKPADWPRLVVVSGMASSSVGWREVPYASLPFPVDGSGVRVVGMELEWLPGDPLRVYVVSGVASADEMMRGEETELMGLLALPEYASFGRACYAVMPGTHSKHVEVRDGQITGLQTFMTGELFAVLADHSLLRFTCDSEGEAWDEMSFMEGVEAARSSGLMRALFQVRTRGVLGGHSGAGNRNYLSGLLIGEEWVRSRVFDCGLPPLLAATGGLLRPYATAARLLGLADRLTLVPEPDVKRALTVGHGLLARHFDGERA